MTQEQFSIIATLLVALLIATMLLSFYLIGEVHTLKLHISALRERINKLINKS